MKISARNQLKGKIVGVTKGQTTAHVRIDIGGGIIVTASITNEAVDDLARGQSPGWRLHRRSARRDPSPTRLAGGSTSRTRCAGSFRRGHRLRSSSI